MDSVADRDHRVRTLLDALPGAVLRGSLAAGTADDLSDIDLAWDRGPAAETQLAHLPDDLTAAGTVESLRLDPDTATDPRRRLVFVRFAGWPVFERVDLELTGTFLTPSAPWATPWSPEESALMNVLGAVKAARRGTGDVDGLLERGTARIGGTDATTGSGPVRDRMRTLAEAAVRRAPGLRPLADRVLAQVDEPW